MRILLVSVVLDLLLPVGSSTRGRCRVQLPHIVRRGKWCMALRVAEVVEG